MGSWVNVENERQSKDQNSVYALLDMQESPVTTFVN